MFLFYANIQHVSVCEHADPGKQKNASGDHLILNFESDKHEHQRNLLEMWMK